MDALEARHLADLTFREVSRSVRALSSAYVEQRLALADRRPLSGRGKRAAFAMFFAPLHYLLVEHIVRSLPSASAPHTIIDLGCGTGAAGAAWAIHCDRTPAIIGIDRNAWALGEAVHTYRMFQLRGRVRHEHIQAARLQKSPAGVLAAFALNELADTDRETLLERLIRRGQDHLLIVEPIAGFVARWWDRWRDRFEAAGGRGDEWRLTSELPPIVAQLDRAAGLDHRQIAGRSLWRPGRSSQQEPDRRAPLARGM